MSRIAKLFILILMVSSCQSQNKEQQFIQKFFTASMHSDLETFSTLLAYRGKDKSRVCRDIYNLDVQQEQDLVLMTMNIVKKWIHEVPDYKIKSVYESIDNRTIKVEVVFDISKDEKIVRYFVLSKKGDTYLVCDIEQKNHLPNAYIPQNMNAPMKKIDLKNKRKRLPKK